jgi:hypothetical protein
MSEQPSCPRCALSNHYLADPSNGCPFIYECVRCNIRYAWFGLELRTDFPPEVPAGLPPAGPPEDEPPKLTNGALWLRTARVPVGGK